MRIVIDMQGAQTASRHRGMGRYSLSFAQAVARNRGEHQVLLALNGLFADTIEPIRAAFDELLPQEAIRVWFAPAPVAERSPGNDARRETAELIREAFLASLAPDVIHISSLFEGYADDAAGSIGRFDHTTPVTVLLCELPDPDSSRDRRYAQHCLRKLEYLKQAAILMPVPELASHQGIARLGVPEGRIFDIAPRKAARRSLELEAAGAGAAPPTDGESPVGPGPADWDAVLPAVDEAARRAIAGWGALINSPPQPATLVSNVRKPRLALVTPLPPERTGIADYSAALLPALREHYEVEVVVAQASVEGVFLDPDRPARDVVWLRAHAHEIDWVVYQVGNSHFHQHMLPLVQEIPGTVVLHDFYLSGLMSWLEVVAGAGRAWAESLYTAHGYGAMRERYFAAEAAQRDFPVNFGLLRHAHGVIVHSHHSRKLAQEWYGDDFAASWEVVPMLRAPPKGPDRAGARKKLGLGKADFVVCSFGFLGWNKLNYRLLSAWLKSRLASDRQCQLVYVGENQADEYGSMMAKAIKRSGHSDRIRITGFTSIEDFQNYLACADVAVQLRTHSRGETSAAVLDCMNFGLPVVVNANGAMSELDPEAVWLLPDEFEEQALVEALETLWQKPERRFILGERAREVIGRIHSPEDCARGYARAIHNFRHRAQTAAKALTHAIASQHAPAADDELRGIAEAIAATLPRALPARRLLLDISATRRNDLKTGIERVARALTLALLNEQPAGYRVEPVHLSDRHGKWHYRFARRYTLELLGLPTDALNDEIVEPAPGDVLLTLDLSGGILVEAAQAGLLAHYRSVGVLAYSVVFDLLPVRMPQVFPPGADEMHARWLSAVAGLDGAICISKAVADDLAAWYSEMGVDWKDRRPFRIGWFPLGADIVNTSPSRGRPGNSESVLRQLRSRPSFLMVGTIEPRKAYLQTIKAFDQLWAAGVECNLVIVGREGWKGLPIDMRRDIPETIECLRSHPRLQKRLFWLEGISDEYLEKVYAHSTCLIAASFGEGFGLPLVEAARHGVPIIARDIPVFREVAGGHAFYFSTFDSGELAAAVNNWLALFSEEAIPLSKGLQCAPWDECAKRLVEFAIENKKSPGRSERP